MLPNDMEYTPDDLELVSKAKVMPMMIALSFYKDCEIVVPQLSKSDIDIITHDRNINLNERTVRRTLEEATLSSSILLQQVEGNIIELCEFSLLEGTEVRFAY